MFARLLISQEIPSFTYARARGITEVTSAICDFVIYNLHKCSFTGGNNTLAAVASPPGCDNNAGNDKKEKSGDDIVVFRAVGGGGH